MSRQLVNYDISHGKITIYSGWSKWLNDSKFRIDICEEKDILAFNTSTIKIEDSYPRYKSKKILLSSNINVCKKYTHFKNVLSVTPNWRPIKTDFDKFLMQRRVALQKLAVEICQDILKNIYGSNFDPEWEEQ